MLKSMGQNPSDVEILELMAAVDTRDQKCGGGVCGGAGFRETHGSLVSWKRCQAIPASPEWKDVFPHCFFRRIFSENHVLVRANTSFSMATISDDVCFPGLN